MRSEPERRAQDAAARWLNRYVEFCGELAEEAIALQAGGPVALVVIPIPGMTRSRAAVLPVNDVPPSARRLDLCLPLLAKAGLRDFIAGKLQAERLEIEDP